MAQSKHIISRHYINYAPIMIEFYMHVGHPEKAMVASCELNPVQKEVVDRGLLSSGFNCVLQMPMDLGRHG